MSPDYDFAGVNADAILDRVANLGGELVIEVNDL
jgi:hypothetical protein